MSGMVLEELRFSFEDAQGRRFLLADAGDFAANVSRALLHYIDDDYVYIFTGDNAYWIRSIYPLNDKITKEYTSRIDFYVPEEWVGNKILTPDIIDKSKYGMRICRWSLPPKKFVLMLIRGSSYRTKMCCLTHIEYGSGDIIARHLPLKSTTPYYKMLHPLFE